jgi:hypothetical protein
MILDAAKKKRSVSGGPMSPGISHPHRARVRSRKRVIPATTRGRGVGNSPSQVVRDSWRAATGSGDTALNPQEAANPPQAREALLSANGRSGRVSDEEVINNNSTLAHQRSAATSHTTLAPLNSTSGFAESAGLSAEIQGGVNSDPEHGDEVYVQRQDLIDSGTDVENTSKYYATHPQPNIFEPVNHKMLQYSSSAQSFLNVHNGVPTSPPRVIEVTAAAPSGNSPSWQDPENPFLALAEHQLRCCLYCQKPAFSESVESGLKV